MKRIFLGLALILSLSVVFSSAHLVQASVYYDYSPDPWRSQRFEANSASGVEQVFQPRDDIVLQGFEFWVDNTGAGGNISFTILDSVGTVLASKSVYISPTAETPGGTKLAVNLSSDLELSSGSTYSIRFSSYPSGLGVYYAESISRFLTHNEVFISEFLLGKARINGVDQEFTFKYALLGYKVDASLEPSTPTEEEVVVEVPEDLIISGAQVVSVTANSATLAWTTNKAANSAATAREQINPLYIISSEYDDTMELEHSIVLTGLKKNFRYFADVYSTDDEGETVSSFTLAFQTSNEEVVEEDPDTEAENSTSTTEDSTDQTQDDESGDGSGDGDSGTNPEDDQDLADSDGDGDPDFDFDSEPTVEDPDQEIVIEGGSSENSFAISWSEPSEGAPSNGYRVDVFDSNNNLVKQFVLDPNTREQEITGLPEGKYRVIVYSNNDGIYKKIAVSEFTVSSSSGALARWSFVGGGVVVAIGLLVWLLRRRTKLSNSV